MKPRKEDSETRYFIDFDLRTREVLDWDFDQRDQLVKHKPTGSSHLRIYVTRGQFNKLEKKNEELLGQSDGPAVCRANKRFEQSQ